VILYLAMDPYANLQDNLGVRIKQYLATITSLDPSKNSAATRGYWKQTGPPTQTFSRQEKRESVDVRFGNHRSVLTDDPALRALWAECPDLLGWAEDIYRVTARLYTTAPASPPAEPFTPPLPLPDELPDLEMPASFPTILQTASLLTICRNATSYACQPFIGYQIQDTIAAAHDHGGAQLFGQHMVDAVLDVLEGVVEPDNTAGEGDFVTSWLAQFTAGGKAIGHEGAAGFYSSVAKVLGGSTTALFIETALGDGRTRPIPTPTGLIGNENDDFSLGDDVWSVFQFLERLAGWPSMPLQDALNDLAEWINPNTHRVYTPQQNPFSPNLILNNEIFMELWADRVETPGGFIWPNYDVEGIYWWRSIVLPICIQHAFPLADTSDFHILALVRFARLFRLFDPDPTKRDSRVPDWVVTNIKLTLLGFKYWFDEAGSPSSDGEMTFWSENHQIQFATSEYIAGTLFAPTEEFTYPADKRKTAADRISRGSQRVSDWLDRRLKFGFSEWNSPSYAGYDFPSLFTLVDFAPDPVIVAKATLVLDTLIFDMARLTCRGSFGVSAGRAYWEAKCYGWEQGTGDLIEVLFGSRGDIIAVSDQSTVSLATSTYQVPDALLAMAIDRRILDRASPQVDRMRVSMLRTEAADNDVDAAKNSNDIVFWWGNMNYFGTETLDITDSVSSTYPNLVNTQPFTILHFVRLKDSEAYQVLYDTVEVAAGAVTTTAGEGIGVLATVLPFPFDLVALVAEPAAIVAGVGMILEGIVHLLGDIVTLIGKGLHAVEHFFGLSDDPPPRIPDSAIVSAFHQLLYAFNDGNVLERANLYYYTNGDAALSSVQKHLPGKMAFQKHPWQATLGPDACVWTTAPFRSTGGASKARAWLDFFTDYLSLRFTAGVASLAISQVDAGTLFGHDGFTYWNGSMALPMIVQYRGAAIIAYQFNDLEKRLSDSATHAWFPSAMFCEVTGLLDANGGTWVFGRKDNTLDAGTGASPNSGYVGLFSARKLAWTTDASWQGKDLIAEGSSNVFVCVVGNQAKFGSFQNFQTQTMNSYLSVEGVGGTKGLQCSFDIPGEDAPAGNAARLELFYDDAKGRFAGNDLDLDAFPRWDNQYASVPWGARSYTITHPATSLFVKHDLDGSGRTFNRQPDAHQQKSLPPQRLVGNSLIAVRRFETAPDVTPVGAQLRKQLFQRNSKP
jgi:hypothetical protein